MGIAENCRLSKWPASLKVLATCFIVTLVIGYVVSLLQVYFRAGVIFSQVIAHYRGDETGQDPLLLPQTFTTLLSVAHVHTFSQPLLFALLGLIFVFSERSEKTKGLLIVAGFAGSRVSNAAPWLIRYTHPQTVLLLPLSQVAIAVSILVMSYVSLREMWR